MLERREPEQNRPKIPGQVLVVEDDPAIITLLGMALEEASYPVKIARNGLEALNYLELTDSPPALILLDLTMPVMGGREFLDKLKTLNWGQNIRVVVMTASREKVAVGEETRVVGYLPKPFDLDELMLYVERFALL